MERIAVFGGTFNPIHNGHIHLAKSFAKALHIGRLLVIPTNSPPHKAARDLAPAADRLAMCRAACRREGFEVSDMEIRRGGPSYTAVTLRELKKLCPDSELFLITGEDMFVTLADWKEPQTIFSLATVCASPRSRGGRDALRRCAAKLQKLGAKTYLADFHYLPVSSTMVREAVRKGKSISDLVPAPVERYIREKKLYLEEMGNGI